MPYTDDYYKTIGEYSQKSALEVVPIVLELIPAQRVIDVGCGDGTWLRVFFERGCEEILGIDGDYVSRETLKIPEDCFTPHDLKASFNSTVQFDLAVSLEVAEHLPPEAARTFVTTLVNLAPVVLFSAAIPMQGGEDHVNEQWPEYWAELFNEHNYVPIDCLRRRIWNNKNVAWWYAQNMLIYVRDNYMDDIRVINKINLNSKQEVLPLVHPDCLAHLYQLIERKNDIIDSVSNRNFREQLNVLCNHILKYISRCVNNVRL